MKIHSKLYIGGEWVDPLNPSIFEAVNPLTETVCATVAGGGEDDVARAVAAAREAFKEFSQSSVEDRRAMLERIAAESKLELTSFQKQLAWKWEHQLGGQAGRKSRPALPIIQPRPKFWRVLSFRRFKALQPYDANPLAFAG